MGQGKLDAKRPYLVLLDVPQNDGSILEEENVALLL